MRKHLILFARAPRYGKVKTRLARDIGKTAALHFYRGNLVSKMHELSRGPWECTVAVASPLDCSDRVFKDYQLCVQPDGDIGSRMRQVLSAYPSDHCLIVGSDVPYVTSNHIRQAFRQLAVHDYVFGPAEDGGYWLVGRRPVAQTNNQFMRNVRWSSPFALDDTIKSLPTQQRVAFIDSLSDVDNGEDYRVYRQWQVQRSKRHNLFSSDNTTSPDNHPAEK